MNVLLFLICLAQTDFLGLLSLSSHFGYIARHLVGVAEGRLHDLLVLQVSVFEDFGVRRLREYHVNPEIQKLDLLLVLQYEVLGFCRMPNELPRLLSALEEVAVDLSHLLVEGLELGLGYAELLDDFG